MTSPRPSDDPPADLPVPTHPHREYVHDHAAALLRYLEEGGGVRFHQQRQYPQAGQLTLTFVVESEGFDALERDERRERGALVSWVWMPKRGLSRRAVPPRRDARGGRGGGSAPPPS
jgi:hypothetical protein